jgi:hypothetical protein
VRFRRISSSIKLDPKVKINGVCMVRIVIYREESEPGNESRG